MKKFITSLLIATTILLTHSLVFSSILNTQEPFKTAFAVEPAPAAGAEKEKVDIPDETIKHLKDLKFNVNERLNLNGGDQKKAYFASSNPIVDFILQIINFALRIIGSLAVIILIVGGFMMMVSQGNQQKVDEAKDIVKYAIIGLIVTFLAYIIVIFVQSLFITI